MQGLGALTWLGTAGLCYAAAWYWLLMLSDALRKRLWPGVVLLLIGGALAVAVAARPLEYPWRLLAPLPNAVGLAAVYWWLWGRRADTWQAAKRRREDGRQAALHLGLATGAAAFTLPYAWMVLTSLKPDDSIFRDPVSLPKVWRWENYPRAFEFMERAIGHVRTYFGSLFVLNTLQVTALSIVGALLTSSMVAYAFGRLRWPGRNILFLVLLATMMLPGAVTMIPRFLIFKQLGWVDTILPLWVPSFFAAAFDVFLLRQFMLTIPNDLEDAAKIDGCSYWTIFWRVMLPLIKPAIAALAILQFLAAWNDFLGPLIYISSPEKMTGSYALRLFQSANAGEWALLLAASTLWTLPVILLFFFAQRAFIEGIALTGMKN